MKKIAIRSLMFISSYFPLYIFLLVLQFKAEFFYECISIKNLIFLLLMIAFILISFFSIYFLTNSKGTNQLRVNGVKRANDEVISYVFTYIIPILSFSLDDSRMLIVNGLLFALIWFLYIKLNLMYLNPLWALWGYVSYEAEGCYIITNMMVDDIKRMNGKILNGYFLVNGVFVAQKENNII
ncbi:hypothetical protein [Phascolarctobacterium faecium]|jgi:hypothetical protein|uniref:hypothetical protein n=1 Tax=Phascolarctobacterium faecium TaxID=33025 RepID=UPI003AF153DB